MAGLILGKTVMHGKLAAIGYRDATIATDTLLGPAGIRLRGHEFRYSDYEGPSYSPAYTIGDRQLGYVQGNILASYLHVHFGSCVGAAASFVDKCLLARRERPER